MMKPTATKPMATPKSHIWAWNGNPKHDL
jgi:hypothetical protein